MVDFEELRARHTVSRMVGVALHDKAAIESPEQLTVGTLRALLDELIALREAAVPRMMCDDQTLADAVRAAARALNPGDIDMELELAAQHIEAGRITTCDPFFYQIDNDRLKEENTALRAAQANALASEAS